MHCSSPPQQGAPGGIRSTRFFPPWRGFEKSGQRSLWRYQEVISPSQTKVRLLSASPTPHPFLLRAVQRTSNVRTPSGESAGKRVIPAWAGGSPRGAAYSPLGEVGRQDAGAARPLRGRKAGGQAEGGMASGSISLGVRNDSWFTKGHCLLR